MRVSLLLLVALGGGDGHADEPGLRPPARGEALWTEGRGGSIPNTPFTLQSFVRLARTLGPAVVNITTVIAADEHEAGATPGAHHPRGKGLGTGFIIHRSGLVLTNSHLVEKSEQITVRLADEREFPARLVGRDERTDIALVQIEAPGPLPVAPLGNSDKLEIGEWVVAIGNPFGLDHTVTAGIVSAKGRRDVRPGGQTNGYYDFIQTDASINAGNSGGPLIDARGEVVGINSVYTEAQGIAFAIPINMAKAIIPLLQAYGHAPRSWLGLFPQSITPSLKRAFQLPDTRGALVSEVVPDSPAAAASLEPGDVVVEFNGHPIRRADDLQWLVATAADGRPVELAVIRGGIKRTLTATPAAAPEESRTTPPSAQAREKSSPLGITVSEINAGIARELGQGDLRGLVVLAVEVGSPAMEGGVERGDRVLRVGDRPVVTIDDYARAVKPIAKGDVIKLLVKRQGRNQWIAYPKR